MNPGTITRAAKPSGLVSWFVIAYLVIVTAGFFTPNSDRVRRRAAYRAEVLTMVSGLHTALKNYETEYGDLPSGDNRTIFRALRGENPRGIVFFDTDERHVSPSGEFLDPWRVPYRFDLSHPNDPRVYSFGSNRRDEGGNGDDVASWK